MWHKLIIWLYEDEVSPYAKYFAQKLFENRKTQYWDIGPKLRNVRINGWIVDLKTGNCYPPKNSLIRKIIQLNMIERRYVRSFAKKYYNAIYIGAEQ